MACREAKRWRNIFESWLDITVTLTYEMIWLNSPQMTSMPCKNTGPIPQEYNTNSGSLRRTFWSYVQCSWWRENHMYIRKYFRRDADFIMTWRPRDATTIGINQSYILGKNNGHFMRASANLFTYIVSPKCIAIPLVLFEFVSHLNCLGATR